MSTGERISPIFVVGTARTGTTWVSNLVCTSKLVVAAQHQLHWGLHESNLYYQQKRWDKIGSLDEYIQFVEEYSATDYFKLVNGEKEALYSYVQSDFFEVFFGLMDRFAVNKGASHWLTKLSPQYLYDERARNELLSRLDERYDTVRWIVTRRNFEDVLESHLHMEGRRSSDSNKFPRRQTQMVLEAARVAVHYRGLSKVVGGYPSTEIKFKELNKSPRETIEAALNAVNTEIEDISKHTPYRPNSSFQYRDASDIRRLGKVEKIVARMVHWSWSLIPRLDILALMFVVIRDAILYDSGESIPGSRYYRLIKASRFPHEFRNELQEKRSVGLRIVVEEQEWEARPEKA